MPANLNKISQFWQELKRRKVIKVIAMYAATAFIILEVVDIVTPALLLPSWTVTLVIVLLAIGFPITVILSWIFDVTPEGIIKTESDIATVDQETSLVLHKRKLKASDFIIAILFVVVIILLYPKIFRADKFEDIRNEDGRISVSVMPFENLSGDSVYNVWKQGFQNLLISTLSNSEELQVRQYQTMSTLLNQRKNINQATLSPSFAREVALNLESSVFIVGKILKAGKMVRVNAQLVNAETEDIYKTYQVDWNTEDDVFAMADSLSGMIRNHLEIRNLTKEFNTPGVNESAFTSNAEAFQAYINGWNAMGRLDLTESSEWSLKAIEADSGFIEAYILLSFSYVAGGNYMQSKYWCNKAYEYRDDLPFRAQLYLDHLYAYHFQNPREEVKLCKQILEIDEMNTLYWFLLGDAYYKLNLYPEAIAAWEKTLEIHEKWNCGFGIPHLYSWMGKALHHLGDHKRENEVSILGLKTLPNTHFIIMNQATCALMSGDQENAEKYIQDLRSLGNSRGWSESFLLSRIGTVYDDADQLGSAENYYRKALKLEPENPGRLNDLAWFLIDHDIAIDEGMVLVVKALELTPEDPFVLDTRGWGLYKQGKYTEALTVLRKSCELMVYHDPDIYQHLLEAEKALTSQTN